MYGRLGAAINPALRRTTIMTGKNSWSVTDEKGQVVGGGGSRGDSKGASTPPPPAISAGTGYSVDTVDDTVDDDYSEEPSGMSPLVIGGAAIAVVGAAYFLAKR